MLEINKIWHESSGAQREVVLIAYVVTMASKGLLTKESTEVDMHDMAREFVRDVPSVFSKVLHHLESYHECLSRVLKTEVVRITPTSSFEDVFNIPPYMSYVKKVLPDEMFTFYKVCRLLRARNG